MANDKGSESFKSPLYSPGTPDMGTKNTVGEVGQPKSMKTPPNPVGYNGVSDSK